MYINSDNIDYRDYSDYGNRYHYVFINGTVHDSHNYWHQHDKAVERFYQQYKINNDGECILCKQKHK